MNKRLILRIAILAMVALASLYLVIRSESAKITTFEECEKAGWLVDRITNYDGYDAKCVLWNGKIFVKQTVEPPFIPPITTEPESLPLTTKEYVYDDKLGYGFEYPDNWEFFTNVDKDVEQCDPSLNYETYTCVDFPDKNIKKVISFTKKLSEERSQPPPQIDFTVKSTPDLQEVKNEFKKELEMSGIPILNEATISVNNISGYDILAGTSDWKLRQVVFFANGMAYIFKYSSQEEFYRMYRETYNNIINSFNIE
jgi:hypothetical protein